VLATHMPALSAWPPPIMWDSYARLDQAAPPPYLNDSAQSPATGTPGLRTARAPALEPAMPWNAGPAAASRLSPVASLATCGARGARRAGAPFGGR